MIRWKCTNCGAVLRAPENAIGKSLPCPSCKYEQKVPSTSSITSLATSAEDGSQKQKPIPTGNSAKESLDGVAPTPSAANASQVSSSGRPHIGLAAVVIAGLILVTIGSLAWWYQFSNRANPERAATVLADSREPSTLDASTPQHEPVMSAPKPMASAPNQHAPLPSATSNETLANSGNEQDATNVEALPIPIDDYNGLATMASQFFRQNGKLARLDPSPETMAKLRQSKSPRTRELYQTLDQALRSYVLADKLQREAADLEQQAIQGYVSSLMASDSNTWVRTEMTPLGVERIETLSSYYTREAISAGFESFGNRIDAELLFNKADESRLAVWDELKSEFQGIANGASLESSGISLSIERTEKTTFEGPIELWQTMLKGKPVWQYIIKATNTSQQDFRDLTLSLTMEAIPSTNSTPTQQPDEALKNPNYYFISHWPAGSSIVLLTGNQWGSDSIRRSIRGTVTYWSNQRRIDPLTINFDENLRSYTADLSRRWNALLDIGDVKSVQSELTHFRKFVPDRLSDLHTSLAKIEQEAAELKRKLDKLLALLSVNKELRGYWNFGKFEGPISIRTVKYEAEDRNSPANLLASLPTYGKVVVEIFKTEQPALYRRLGGAIHCTQRKWHIPIVGLSDSGDRGFDKTGIARVDEFFPTANKVLEKDGPELRLSLDDSDTILLCQSNIGDLMKMVPADDFEATQGKLSDIIAEDLIAKRLGALKPLPTICFEQNDTSNQTSAQTSTGELLRGIGDANGLYSIEQVFLSNDSRHGISHSRNGELRMWNLPQPMDRSASQAASSSTKSASASFGEGKMESGTWLPMAGPVSISDNFQLAASMGDYGSVNFFDLKGKKPPTNAELNVGSMQLMKQNNQNLLAGVTSLNKVTIWDEKGKVIFEQPLSSKPQTFRGSGDGHLIAVSVDDKILVWQVTGSKLVSTLQVPQIRPKQIIFSVDRKYLMVVGPTAKAEQLVDSNALPAQRIPTQLVVVEMESGQQIYSSELGTLDSIIAVSSDWSTIALALEDGPIAVWSLQTGLLRSVSIGHRRRVTSLTLSNDGKFALSGGAGFDTYVLYWGIHP